MAALLAFGASLAWGLADFLGGLASRRLSVVLVLGAQQVTSFVIVAIITVASGPEAPGTTGILVALLSGVFQAIGMAAYYQALSTGVMGVVAPISATGALVPLLMGLAAGDDPSGLQATGMVLAVAGVAAAAYQPSDSHLDPRRTAVGAGMALVAAICLGSFFALLDVASDRADLRWVVLINRIGAIAMLGVVAVAIRERLRRDGAHGTWRATDVATVLLVGLLASSATFLFAAATTRGLISVVSVIGALYPVTTVVLARLFLGERMRTTQRVGTLSALAGVGLISV